MPAAISSTTILVCFRLSRYMSSSLISTSSSVPVKCTYCPKAYTDSAFSNARRSFIKRYISSERIWMIFRGNLQVMLAGVSTSRICPFCIKATRSQRSASFMYGVETRIVMPFSCSFFSISQNSFLDTASTPVVGSSNTRILGLWINAHESASFCFIPPESFPARRVLKGSIW